MFIASARQPVFGASQNAGLIMRQSIQEDTLRVMLEANAVREALPAWASLTVVRRFAESTGIRSFQVEV